MMKTRTYLGIATLGVLIAPIISFPQDISFGDSRQIGFGGGDKDDNVKPKINGKSIENSDDLLTRMFKMNSERLYICRDFNLCLIVHDYRLP